MAESPTATGPPVFVVGISRSGTTLLSAMLSAHSRLDCGPESHLLVSLGALEPDELGRLLEPRTWPESATDFVAGHEHGGHRSIDQFGLERSDIETWLTGRPPSMASVLESLTAQHARGAGKARWVEKTPRHLLALTTIREAWPDAYVVRIVRDPRDSAVSLTGMPFAADTQLGNLIRIDYDDRRSRAFFRRDARAMTLRYEDLVTEPERELRRVCGFIGEDYEPSMLDRTASAARVTADHEWWKESVSGPLRTSSVGRWQNEMPDEAQRFASLYLAGYLDTHDYEGSRQPAGQVAVVPIGDLVASRDEALLLALSSHDLTPVRPSPRWASDLRRQRRLVFVGARGQLDPIRNRGSGERLRNTLALGAVLLERRLRRRPALWIDEASRRGSMAGDPFETAIAASLRLFARRVDAADAPALLAGEYERGEVARA